MQDGNCQRPLSSLVQPSNHNKPVKSWQIIDVAGKMPTKRSYLKLLTEYNCMAYQQLSGALFTKYIFMAKN